MKLFLNKCSDNSATPLADMSAKDVEQFLSWKASQTTMNDKVTNEPFKNPDTSTGADELHFEPVRV